jgi:hypothetical protein
MHPGLKRNLKIEADGSSETVTICHTARLAVWKMHLVYILLDLHSLVNPSLKTMAL